MLTPLRKQILCNAKGNESRMLVRNGNQENVECLKIGHSVPCVFAKALASNCHTSISRMTQVVINPRLPHS